MSRCAAVTFDYWNTLVVAPDPEAVTERRVLALTEAFGDRGVSPDEVRTALAEVAAAHTASWKANQQYVLTHAVEHLVDALGLRADESARLADESARLADVMVAVRDDARPALAPGVGEVLTALADRGVRIGIICDVGLAPSTVLRDHLEHHGVLSSFDHWSFSDEVGWYKPHAEIFGHALAGLGGVDPEASAHVGDLRRTDVAGSRSAGMTAVRYCGVHDDPDDGPEGDHVVAHHAELLAVLDLAS